MTIRTLEVLMPMGGLGQRFRNVGITTPKPLIDVAGTPMLLRAFRSVPSDRFRVRLTAVVRREHEDEFGLATRISDLIPDTRIAYLDHDTRGAVETALFGAEGLDPQSPLLLLDCDIAFESDEFVDAISAAVDGHDDGVLLSFRSKDPRYSFAEVDVEGRLVRTAEKRAISDRALMGAYFFRTVGTFTSAAERLMSHPIDDAMREYYVSLVYNELLANGGRVRVANGTFYCFGTPEELAEFVRTGNPVGD